MTFQEITERRMELAPSGLLTTQREQPVIEAEWHQVCMRRECDYTECGITYQRCGGGRRIIRKRIGGD